MNRPESQKPYSDAVRDALAPDRHNHKPSAAQRSEHVEGQPAKAAQSIVPSLLATQAELAAELERVKQESRDWQGKIMNLATEHERVKRERDELLEAAKATISAMDNKWETGRGWDKKLRAAVNKCEPAKWEKYHNPHVRTANEET